MTTLQLHELWQVLVMVHEAFLVGTVSDMLMLTDPKWSLSYLHAASSLTFVMN